MIALLVCSLLAMLFFTVPIFTGLAICTLVTFAVFFPGQNMDIMMAQSLVKSCDNFSLLAIPFFMLVGTLMSEGGLAKKLVGVAEALTGDKPGGLANAAILASMLFAAISGSGPATAAAIGGIMIPSMIKQGYDKSYSASLLASGSTIGPVIPPSIPMITYSVAVGCSTVAMFAAGVIPGIAMGVGLMIYNGFVSRKHNYRGNKTYSREEKLKAFKSGIPALLMPIIVLGGIYSGIFTPTESAVVGCAYTLLVSGLVYKTLTWKGLKAALIDAGISSATIMLLFGGANTFGRILTLGNVPNQIVNAIFSFTSSKVIILLIINVLLLLAGMFIDTNSCVVLFSPIIVPLMISLGYNEITAGVMIVVNLCIGMVTPPMGPDLFITMKIADTPLQKALPSAVAQIGIMYLVLAILVIFPQSIEIIPKLLGLM